ncbi:metallophosphoesterase [Thermoactinomyces vulgaris]|uniref:metallophosphoesterase n=1 Tax=Thermoactinomyces vulgaris TaxID=2026 RepID=UPI0006731449|nr:metallophosphoesterase [Thermoactinomyces vulgaris]
MWGLVILIFLTLYGLMGYYIGRKGWKYLIRKDSPVSKVLFIAALLALIVPFPLSELGKNLLPERIGSWLGIWGGHSMIIVLYLFFLILMLDVVRFIDRLAKFIPPAFKNHHFTPYSLAAAVFLLATVPVAYGSWNAQHPVVKKYNVHVNKDAGEMKQLRIAMVSDIHYGPVIDTDRLKTLQQMIHQIKPDLVLLAGDITNGPLPPGEDRKLATALGNIKATYGVYAVPGNHDRDLAERGSELMQALKQAGIKVLKDEKVVFPNRFTLIGRDDPHLIREPGRKDLASLMKGTDSSQPLILLDHQPIELEQAQKNGIDLMLSGHTHHGQIFPGNWITAMIYENDWGLLQKGGFYSVVSCGFGTWGPPLRIGNRPEVVEITMNFT